MKPLRNYVKLIIMQIRKTLSSRVIRKPIRRVGLLLQSTRVLRYYYYTDIIRPGPARSFKRIRVH